METSETCSVQTESRRLSRRLSPGAFSDNYARRSRRIPQSPTTMLRVILPVALLFYRVFAFAQETAAPGAVVSGGSVPSTAAPPAPSSTTTPLPEAPGRIAYSQCHVEGPYIAMTFDDGPHAQNTPRLLEMLKKRNIKGTFFVVGQCVEEHPDVMKRIVADGHEIANHSWSHPSLSKMSEEAVSSELQRTHDIIVETTGVTPTIMRPPYGAFTPSQRAWANKKWGYKIILWDVDPLDWRYRNAARVESEILKQTVPGSIVLSHDIHKSTVDAMPETLDALANKGFKFVTVSELIAMDRPAPVRAKATRAPRPSEAQTTAQPAAVPPAATSLDGGSPPASQPGAPQRR
jgi:peptidoglycan-N-acetylglucosamine deacetylase